MHAVVWIHFLTFATNQFNDVWFALKNWLLSQFPSISSLFTTPFSLFVVPQSQRGQNTTVVTSKQCIASAYVAAEEILRWNYLCTSTWLFTYTWSNRELIYLIFNTNSLSVNHAGATSGCLVYGYGCAYQFRAPNTPTPPDKQSSLVLFPDCSMY